MCRLWRMPVDRQLKELRVAMRKLLWKMLRVLTPECFCILIGSRKHVTWIVKLTKANKSNCWKNIAKKFEMLTIKHTMPNVNWITQTKVGTKWSLWHAVNLTVAIVVFATLKVKWPPCVASAMPCTFWRSVPHQVCAPICSLHCVAHKVKWRYPCWHPHHSHSGSSLQVTKRMRKIFVNTSAFTIVR